MQKILSEPVELRLAKAKNPNTGQEILSVLSTDTFWFVRDFVANNPNTPKEILLKLLNDPDFRIRYDAKKNLHKENLDQQIAFAAQKKQEQSPKQATVFHPQNQFPSENKEIKINLER